MELASSGVGVRPLAQEALVLHLLTNDSTRNVDVLAPYNHLHTNHCVYIAMLAAR